MNTAVRKRSSYEHPHQRMARERRHALRMRRLITAALVLLVTMASVGGALIVTS